MKSNSSPSIYKQLTGRDDDVVTPFDSIEFREKIAWEARAMLGKNKIIKCICGWFDICGFGSLLERSYWKLNKAKKNSIFKILMSFYKIASQPYFLTSLDLINERNLMLNDGMAKAIDISNINKIDEYLLLEYLNHILIDHYQLIIIMREYNLGIRTVFCSGERTQFAPQQISGVSFFHYNKSHLSDYGKAFLNRIFLYNPSELQMNTAFAKAYTVENSGSSFGIKVNKLYLEKTIIEMFCKRIKNKRFKTENRIDFYLRNQKAFELYIGEEVNYNNKGIKTVLFPIESFKVCHGLEGEEVYFDLNNAYFT